MRSVLPLVILLAASVLYPQIAHAEDYTVCFRVQANVADHAGQAANGEKGNAGTTNWTARGMYIELYGNGESWTGWVDDDTGCKTVYGWSPGTYFWKPYAEAWLDQGGASVDVKVMNSSSWSGPYSANSVQLGSSGTYTVTYSFNSKLLGQAAKLAYIIQREFRGNVQNETFKVYHCATWSACSSVNPCTCSNNGCYCKSTDSIYMTDAAWDRKYVLAHEYGHANIYAAAGDYVNDCSLNGSGHGLKGPEEYDSCAFMEGWADFVAVDSWFPHTTSWSGAPGWFVRANSTNDPIDAKSGSGSCSVSTQYPNYMHQNCFSGDSGEGSEVDWMRALWDYHTRTSYSGGGVVPSHQRLQEEIGASPQWNKSNACEKYAEGVESYSGSAQQARWNYYINSVNLAGTCSI